MLWRGLNHGSQLGKELKDDRAVDRTGVFLKRVEAEQVGVVE